MQTERMYPHKWIREVEGLNTVDKLVYMYLSQRQGNSSYISTSQADIADFCSCSLRSVTRAQDKLIANGLLTVASGQFDGRGNRYSVLIPEWVDSYEVRQSGVGGTPQSRRGTSGSRTGTPDSRRGTPQGRTIRTFKGPVQGLNKNSDFLTLNENPERIIMIEEGVSV